MSRKTILTTFLLVTTLLIVLFLWRGGHWLVVVTPLQPADAIVMLRGSTPERELEVADLYHADYAELILFADFDSHSTKLLDSSDYHFPIEKTERLSVKPRKRS